MKIFNCLFLKTHRTYFSPIEGSCNTWIANVHTVLMSLVAPVLGYEISAPQGTLDIKKTPKISICKIFLEGFLLNSLPQRNTCSNLNCLLHHDTMYSCSCISELQRNIFPPLFKCKYRASLYYVVVADFCVLDLYYFNIEPVKQ